MTVLGRGHEPDALGRGDCSLSQTIGQTRNSMYVCYRSAGRKYGSQGYHSGNLILARGLCISRLGFLKHAGFGSNLSAAKDSVVIGAAAAAAGASTPFATVTATGVAAIAGAIAATVTGTYTTSVTRSDSVAGTGSG